MTLEDYFNGTAAVDHFVRVVKKEDGKPIVVSISPYGIPGEPYEFKVDHTPAKKETAHGKDQDK